MRNTFAKTLKKLADEIPGICLIVSDLSPASAKEFQEAYPHRFINVGVSEQAMIGMSAGMALRGYRPFAYTIATFSAYRPFEMVRDDLCYQNVPVTVVGMGAGVAYSSLGGTHHAQEDVGLLSCLPNMTILAPCDPRETESALWECARSKGPVYLRLGKAGEPDLSEKAPDPFVFGKVRLLKAGKDAAIISFGTITKMAMDVAQEIGSGGKSAAVYSCHTMKPIDREGIGKILRQYPVVMTIEEHSERAGLAAQTKQIGWETRANCQLLTYSLKDEFIHFYGSHPELLAKHGLDPRRIIQDFRKLG